VQPTPPAKLRFIVFCASTAYKYNLLRCSAPILVQKCIFVKRKTSCVGVLHTDEVCLRPAPQAKLRFAPRTTKKEKKAAFIVKKR
jgi:hypothetical protein